MQIFLENYKIDTFINFAANIISTFGDISLKISIKMPFIFRLYDPVENTKITKEYRRKVIKYQLEGAKKRI